MRPVTVTSASPAGPASPYCQITASKSSSVAGRGRSRGPTAVAHRWVAPSGSRPMPMVKRGTMRWPSRADEEGEGAQGHDPRARTPHGVVAGDGRQERGGLPGLHQDGGAPAHQRESGPVEEDGRAAVELQGVGTVVQRHRAGVQVGDGHRGRGPADPGGEEELAESSREGADTDTGVARLAQHAAQHRRGGQVGHRARQVAVGVPVGQGAADHGDDAGEPDVVAGPERAGGRGVDLEQGDASPRPDDPRRLGQGGGQVGEVAQGVPADEPVEGAVGKGQPTAVGLHERHAAAVGRQHAAAQVGPDDAVAPAEGHLGEVAGAAGQIEEERPGGQGEGGDGGPSPELVEPEGHEAVDQVVAGGDGVEHGADSNRLLLAHGKRLGLALDRRRPAQRK